MEKNKLGVALFIAAEATFFLFLLLVYVNFHGPATQGPTAASTLAPGKTGIYTLLLLSSSLTLGLAESGNTRHSRARLCLWLAVTIGTAAGAAPISPRSGTGSRLSN